MGPYLLLLLLSLVIGYAFTRWLINDERRVASERQDAGHDGVDDPAPSRIYRAMRTLLPTLAFGLLAGITLCALLWSSGAVNRFGV